MELGGKSPLVILPDADIDEAADIAMVANFFSIGQVCTNGTRVFIPTAFLEKFKEAMTKRYREGIQMGLPRDSDTNFGPVMSAAQRDKVNIDIKHGREVDRARVLYDGAVDDQKVFPIKDGFWVPPVIFSDCTDDMRVTKEEIFWPRYVHPAIRDRIAGRLAP